jgi:ADP-heptose:LPS heptosyltransferase
VLSLRAPDHLGDLVMALPAIRMIASAAPTAVHARAHYTPILHGLDLAGAETPPSGTLGVMMKPSAHAAMQWRRHVPTIGIGSRLLYTHAIPPRHEHRRESYMRLATAALAVLDLPTPTPPPPPTPTLSSNVIALNPWSPTPTVRWPYFRELADALHARGDAPIFFCGPGEGPPVREIAGPYDLHDALPLDVFVSTVATARAFVSNDSGAAHLAAAVGTRVIMIHGSTTAAITGAGTPVEGPDLFCRPCYRKWCFRDLACLRAITVQQILAAIDRP